MATTKDIQIEVAYAEPHKQLIVELAVPGGTTAREALQRSGLSQQFAALDTSRAPLGIFGKPVADDYQVKAGDRVEAYRELIMDPGEARRARAAAAESED